MNEKINNLIHSVSQSLKVVLTANLCPKYNINSALELLLNGKIQILNKYCKSYREK